MCVCVCLCVFVCVVCVCVYIYIYITVSSCHQIRESFDLVERAERVQEFSGLSCCKL